MKKVFSFIFSLLCVFMFAQNTFANSSTEQYHTYEIKDNYQKVVFKNFNKRYNLESLSEEESNTLNKLIKIANKNNYKLIANILKKESFENIDKIADIEVNTNLSNSNANKKMYKTAYILLIKGLFTNFPDENLIKPVIKNMYNCENEIDNHQLAVYGALYLYHKENTYNIKELLENTNSNNYKEKLKEISFESNCDLKRFFPENKEMLVLISNIPQPIKDDIGISNEIKACHLSAAKCIISPNYYATNMLLLSTKMDGATKKGAVLGLINPINIVSNIFLSPIYLLGHYLTPLGNN